MTCAQCGAEWRPRGAIGGYELGEMLARSGFAQIFRASDSAGGASIAVKIFSLPEGCEQEDLERFENDARVLSELDHPNWVRVFGGGTDEDFAWLAMECLPGGSLAAMGKMGDADALQAGVQIADAMAAARASGLQHCNLQIGECLLDDARTVKVSGFAEAGFYRGAARHVGTVWGRLSCAPPERFFEQAENVESEIYALGAILFQLLAGEPPYEGVTMPEFYRDLIEGPPLRLKDSANSVRKSTAALVERMLALDPAQRFSSWDEAADALRDELGSLSQTASRGSVHARPVARPTPRAAVKAPVYSARGGAWFTIFMLAGIVGFAGWFGWKQFYKPPPEPLPAAREIAVIPTRKPAPAPSPVASPTPAIAVVVTPQPPPPKPEVPKMDWAAWKKFILEAPARLRTVGGEDGRIPGSGGLRLSGNNSGMTGGHDENVFFARQLDGDWTLTARVSANSGPAGVAARESLGSDRPCVGVFLTADGSLKTVLREQPLAKVVPAPVAVPPGSRWLRVARRGSAISAFHSPDGKHWREAVTLNLPSLPPSLPAGFVVWSGAKEKMAAATFDEVTLTMGK